MKKKISKELREWVILVSIVFGLYVTGLHTEAIGLLQRIILSSHVLTADILDDDKLKNADYDFSLIDVNGNTIDFSSMKGKTIFFNFWATWCPPCIAEMPDINDLYQKVNEDVVFVMLSRDEDFNKAIKFIDKKAYDFPIYQLIGTLPQVYHSQSIPTTFVISPDGKIVSKTTGMAKYDTDSFKAFLLGLNTNPPSGSPQD